MIVNFVNNAVKYAPKSPLITISVEQPPKQVKIAVIDHGPSIAPEHLQQSFDRYFQVGGKKSGTSGLGLGLYISAEIIRRHGGEIGVESEPEKGQSFGLRCLKNNRLPSGQY